jgi:hypothetical protein
VARRLGVPGERLDHEVAEMWDYVIAKTASRRVLGVMNEFAEMADHYRRTEDEIDLVELSLWLAQTPCGPLYGSYVSPDRALQATLS